MKSSAEKFSPSAAFPERLFDMESMRDTLAAAPPQPERPAKSVVAALILRGSQVLICQRRADQPMALKWEFPGGKVEAGESLVEALRRELNEELGIEATIGESVTRIRHNYKNGGAVDLAFFAVHSYQGELENRIFKEFRWAELRDLPSFDFLAADRTFVRDLAAGKLL